MNRAEYARAIRHLLDLDIDVAQYLPPDTISHGFDNVADVQTFSPTLMEGYLRAASQISRLAVGDRNATATSTTYKLGRTMSQMRHVEGTPIGTRGGTAITHVFPRRRRLRLQGRHALRAARRPLRPLDHGDVRASTSRWKSRSTVSVWRSSISTRA